ncbi:MAG: 2-succinyl-6-hydroxy-2,4-cyclohexadiene-1-carboxylate synthase [Phycisphaerae bacterium]|nr:2-succinyl-6-hydroxy-2,4-cyclohexadiene-1-carboxylate synthase [Phycisphaerae bacterium]
MQLLRRAILAAAPLLMLPAAGCKVDYDAKADRLIKPASVPGQVMLGLTGTADDMVRQGRISAGYVMPGVDGVKLDVWVIRSRLIPTVPPFNRVTRGTVVVLHPLLASKTWFLDLGERLANRGWDVVLPDLRGHGRSEGRYITWGAKEKRDIKLVVDDLLKRGAIDPRILAFGASLGGMVAIQYAAIDPRVRGVMAVAPPESCREITRRILALDKPEEYDEALRRAAAKGGFNPDDASTLDAAARLRCPLLLVHGLLDTFVPYQHGEHIVAAAAGPRKLITLKFDGHASEIGRTDWLADRIDELDEMARKDHPATAPADDAP